MTQPETSTRPLPPQSPALVRGGVTGSLFTMALPMLAGTFAMNAYNLTDTWFVSRLGTLPLAAMGFTFPVVMLLTCVARGIGSGVTTLVSHAMGRDDHQGAVRLVTHGLALTVVVALVMSLGGYLLMVPIFRRLGADAQIMPLVSDYMRVWYFGAVFMALPMLGNGVLISAGDSKAASRFIILGTLLNMILDPVMIFGFLGVPAMGIRGAALATVISQAVSALWLLHLLWKKHRLLSITSWCPAVLLASLRRISSFAVPSICSMILMPLSATVITRILSGFGHEAIAASGAAGRLEMFAFMVPMALGISLTPFVSQNVGAQRFDRVCEAQRTTTLFALGYGALITLVFVVSAPWLAAVFTDDPKVAGILILYIRTISFGYGMMEVHRYCGFFLTGMHRPVSATILNAIRVLVFLIPCSFIGAHYWGIPGVFGGRLLTDLLAASVGMAWVWRILHGRGRRDEGVAPA